MDQKFNDDIIEPTNKDLNEPEENTNIRYFDEIENYPKDAKCTKDQKLIKSLYEHQMYEILRNSYGFVDRCENDLQSNEMLFDEIKEQGNDLFNDYETIIGSRSELLRYTLRLRSGSDYFDALK